MTELTMPLGGVPTRVAVPPSEEAKATGMRILLGAILAEAHIPMIMGTATQVVPVFESTVDRPPTAIIEKSNNKRWLPLESFNAVLPTMSAKPVTKVDSPTMNMAMNRITVLSPK